MIKVHTIVNTILRSCTYILHNEDKYVYLIDCGDIEPILSFIKINNKVIKGIFLTHCHYDHIYGINQITNMFPDTIIYASAETIVGLKDSRINLSKYNGEPMILSEDAIAKEISKLSDIQIFNKKIIIIETPGHDTGCLSYLIGNMLFTGDSYIPNIPVFTKWKRSDKIVATKTENRLKEFLKNNKLSLYSGHLI